VACHRHPFGRRGTPGSVGVPSGKACIPQKGIAGSSKGVFQRNPFGRIPLRRQKVLKDMGFYVYILQSKSHLTYYYGHCENLDKRLTQHTNGKVKYTKGRRPWVLHYYEAFETRS